MDISRSQKLEVDIVDENPDSQRKCFMINFSKQ